MAIFKYREFGTLVCPVLGNVKLCHCYEKYYGSSLKKSNTEVSCNPSIPLLGIYPKKLKARSRINIVYPFHSNIIHNHQKVKATQVFFDRWMDKQKDKQWDII